ncbi:hypothetical protein SUGI_1197500 [Cryptomeria japonica]|uniref:E3 SUMO-protein ligase MMS21 n=1 Tax=Cryptomeria japonica TaxID=3369 RepID=UPI002414CF93|nr:E3 SUMO-protein ligase MMS21 [Cryptomeria japonica]GLJ55767.1 hypothetical protein SUGI_1197500 [Cryptomeria japonica]
MAMSTADRIGVTVSNLETSNHSLIADVRNLLVTIKMIAQDLEKENKSDLVKQLDKATLELIPLSDDIVHLSTALQAVGKDYNSSNESTDFKKLLDEHISQLEADTPCVPENHVFYKQFKEAIWRVRHADEPMPGEEHEEIIMTSSQCNLVNTSCPLTGKPVTELKDPVRSMECKHIYEKEAVMNHIRMIGKKRGCRCAAAGCPKMLTAEILICDPLLKIEIEELRLRGDQSTQAQIVADCTEIDED